MIIFVAQPCPDMPPSLWRWRELMEGGPKHAHGCACTHTHSFYLASAHKGHIDTEIIFPTTLERSSHMALLTSTTKRPSPQVHRKEVIKHRLAQNPYGYQAFPRSLGSNIKEMVIASPGLLCKQIFFIKIDSLCTREKAHTQKKCQLSN